MSRPAFDLGEIARLHRSEFLAAWGGRLSPHQLRVFEALAACRTAALGGHLELCPGTGCHHQEIAYNSCKNRHCPKCHGPKTARWLEARAAELLDVPYFHVVFTLPHELAPLALQNPRLVYGLLFTASAQTLQAVAADPRHLQADIGLLAVLHTWGQTLEHHPHIHCVVPGGGLARLADTGARRWVSSGEDFFLPVRALSRVFRGKVLGALERAYKAGELILEGSLEPLRSETSFKNLLRKAAAKKWVVYCKPPFRGRPEQILKYIARYTHRVAISNDRLERVEDGRVTFRYKDYADAARVKSMTLDAVEFLRRFLLHVVPAGFVRIRTYGFLANRDRKANIELCRQLIDRAEPGEFDEEAAERFDAPAADSPSMDENDLSITPADPDLSGRRCPICKAHRLVRGTEFRPGLDLQIAEARLRPREDWPRTDTS